MKFDLTNWAKNKKRIFFLIVCPMALSTVINIVVGPVLHASPKFALLTSLLEIIVFVPSIIVELKRYKAETEREKREMQARYDAEDKAMFGKPLREFEL